MKPGREKQESPIMVGRLVVVLIGLPLFAGAIAYGGWPLTAALMVLSLLGYREFSRVLRHKNLEVVREVGYTVCLAFILAAQVFPSEDLTDALLGVLFFCPAASFAAQCFRSPEASGVSHVGATVLGCLYVGLGLSFCVLLRAVPGPLREIGGYLVPYGAQLLGLTVAATWAAEGLIAFLHPPTPPVESPFAWRAAALGFGAALGVVVWGGSLWEIVPLHRWALGGLLGAAVMGGQHTKKFLLRESGSSQFDGLLSGHISVLAYFSSLLWTVPVAYFCAILWL